jgi:hypothetical protein
VIGEKTIIKNLSKRERENSNLEIWKSGKRKCKLILKKEEMVILIIMKIMVKLDGEKED